MSDSVIVVVRAESLDDAAEFIRGHLQKGSITYYKGTYKEAVLNYLMEVGIAKKKKNGGGLHLVSLEGEDEALLLKLLSEDGDRGRMVCFFPETPLGGIKASPEMAEWRNLAQDYREKIDAFNNKWRGRVPTEADRRKWLSEKRELELEALHLGGKKVGAAQRAFTRLLGDMRLTWNEKEAPRK